MRNYTPDQKEAIKDVLDHLLKYEGEHAQTICGSTWRRIFNSEIMHMAAAHEVELNPVIVKDCGIRR